MAEEWNKGGLFIFTPSTPEDIFIVEDFDDEEMMFAKTADDFIYNEVLSRKDEVEDSETKIKVHTELMKKAGEIGMLMVEVPEEFGGLGMHLKHAMLVAEHGAKNGSFTTSMMCHTGIGTLPIVYFGTQEQKEEFLPKLATGEFLGAYALTEEGSGSDALNAKTKAVLSEDGEHWILNGVKQFITNAGFADVSTVYAKIDGEKFTGFIVPMDAEGVSIGAEEHKMGIKGSSTCQLILDDAKIPKSYLLGEPGKGHKIALNILNIGRLKLGLGSLGGAKEVLKDTLAYAAERKQFNTTLNQFQMMKRKFADMVTGIYATESMAYRCAGDIDRAIEGIGVDETDDSFWMKKIDCIEQYAIEAAMLKVYGSEMFANVVDEGVAIHGGYGFIEEYPVCGAYRDARINRIFEGTNEVNRMLMPGTLMKRAMAGKIDLMTPIMGLMGEIKADSINKEFGEGVLGREATALEIIRKHAILGLGVPAQKAMADPKFMMKNQILLEQLADLFMALYAAESSYLRTLKLIEKKGEAKCKIPIKLTQVIVYENLRKAAELTRQICANTCEGDDEAFAKNLKAINRLSMDYGLDTMTLKAEICDHVVERTDYNLE